MNDIINTSEEEWVLETPPSYKTSSNISDTINTSSKLATESVDKSAPCYEKIDIYESEDEWIDESLPNCKTLNEITLINDDKNNKSEGRIIFEKAFQNRTKKNTLTNTSEEEWIVDFQSCCNTDQTNKASEERHGKSYYRHRQNHFETRQNSELHGNMHRRSYNSQTQLELKKIDESHKYKYVKSCFESGENNNIDRDIYKKSFNQKTIHSLNDENKSNEKRFMNLPNRSGSKSNNLKGDKKKWKPNVKAQDFTPLSEKNSQSKVNTEQLSPLNNSIFSHFSLRDLLNYDVDLMPSEELTNYTDTLILRVLDTISEFEPLYRDELEVLCQLNDGSLTDRNKKIISLRICTLINRTVVNEPQCNWERSWRRSRMFPRFCKLDGE